MNRQFVFGMALALVAVLLGWRSVQLAALSHRVTGHVVFVYSAPAPPAQSDSALPVTWVSERDFLMLDPHFLRANALGVVLLDRYNDGIRENVAWEIRNYVMLGGVAAIVDSQRHADAATRMLHLVTPPIAPHDGSGGRLAWFRSAAGDLAIETWLTHFVARTSQS
ncbi:MAG: hypothetical protein ACREM2_00620 [Vulcanimicrobiaceae bacterium]